MGLRRILKNIQDHKKHNSDYLNISYSQEGEDLILDRLFEDRKYGFFVDVGALHPQRFSNTYKFYQKGWKGINIDAMPGSMKLFKEIRPLDINLEIPIADHAGLLDYHIFNEPALNTLSKEIAEAHSQVEGYFIKEVIRLETNTLKAILDQYLPSGQMIDFLTIDAEGLDFQILKSNDWTKYRPNVVLIENYLTLKKMTGSEIDSYLTRKGYEMYAKTVNTYFYIRIEEDALA